MHPEYFSAPAGLQALWLLHKQKPQSYLYPLAFRISGPLDPDLLHHCLQELVNSHPALRIRIKTEEAGAGIVIEQPGNVPGCSRQEIADDADTKQLKSTRAEAFLSKASQQETYSLHACIIRADSRLHYLLLCAHHLSVDAWSMSLLMNELKTRYEAGIHQKYFPGIPPDNFLQWLEYRKNNRPQELSMIDDFWRPALKKSPALHRLRIDEYMAGRPGAVETPISIEVARQLHNLAGGLHCTLFMLMQILFSMAVALCTAGNRVTTATPRARRYIAEPECPDLTHTVGCITGLICIPFSYSNSENTGDIIQRMRESILAAFDHDTADFADVVTRLAPQRFPARNPLVQILFTHRHVPEVPLTLTSCKVEPLSLFSRTPGLELEVELVTKGSKMFLGWLYDGYFVTEPETGRLITILYRILDCSLRSDFLTMKPENFVC